MKKLWLPEGSLIDTPENLARCSGVEALLRAMSEGTVLEGEAVRCDPEHNLMVKIGPFMGVIPRSEAAIGISEGTTRDIAILSRVGKPVAFTVMGIEECQGDIRPILSRKRAQELALEHFLTTLRPGDIIPCTVTHMEPFGAFVDIGCGVPSMISIENISVSRLPHPDRRFRVGQFIYSVVTGIDFDKKRVLLSHKELLGTWEENAADFAPGMTVPGYVRGVKEYGIFVELTPNLSGLAERKEGFSEGERVSVYIKSIQPELMKIKLLLIDHLPPATGHEEVRYWYTEGNLKEWEYRPAGVKRVSKE